MKVDFYATQTQYVDHQLPIWDKLGDARGTFFTGRVAFEHAQRLGVDASLCVNSPPHGDSPMLVASVGDLALARRVNKIRTSVLMEHGLGIVYPGNPSYAGNSGERRFASLTLAPNQHVHDLTAKAVPEMVQRIIGTPKLDRYAGQFDQPRQPVEKPIVAITFHWDGSLVAPEAGSALPYFRNALHGIAREESFRLVAHAHPRSTRMVKPFYKSIGVEFWDSFERVMSEADVLIVDNSSVLYEYLVTGRRVIILNSPRYRKNVDFGIRFWKYTDIGLQVDKPDKLLGIIKDTLSDPEGLRDERRKAIDDLFPFLGHSSQIAADSIIDFLKENHE